MNTSPLRARWAAISALCLSTAACGSSGPGGEVASEPTPVPTVTVTQNVTEEVVVERMTPLPESCAQLIDLIPRLIELRQIMSEAAGAIVSSSFNLQTASAAQNHARMVEMLDIMGPAQMRMSVAIEDSLELERSVDRLSGACDL